MDCCTEGDAAIDERLSIISAQRDSVVAKMKEMQDMLDMLEYKCWYYETAKESGTCGIHEEMRTENVPEKFHRFL